MNKLMNDQTLEGDFEKKKPGEKKKVITFGGGQRRGIFLKEKESEIPRRVKGGGCTSARKK